MNWNAVLDPSLENDLHEILSQAPVDFTANLRGYFSEEDLQSILTKAQEMLFQKLQAHPARVRSDLAQAWNQVVTDFHTHQCWGFQAQATAPKTKKPMTPQRELAMYIGIFLGPTLLLKTGIMYFGMKYSNNPGEGYGWALTAAIVLSVINFSAFIWFFRKRSF